MCVCKSSLKSLATCALRGLPAKFEYGALAHYKPRDQKGVFWLAFTMHV